MMDLKSKGIAWVGNMFQKFETMCQEVDDIVSQDTVKYVENQMQTVGVNVKKFYNDVVQDLLPPFVDPGKHEALGVALNQIAACATDIKSTVDVEENPVDIDNWQASGDPCASNPVKKHLSDSSSISRLHNINELTSPSSMDSIEESDINLSYRRNEEACLHKNSEVSVEEKPPETKPSPSEVLEVTPTPSKKDYCEALSSRESIYENHENSCGIRTEIAPATSHCDSGFNSHQQLGLICYQSVNGTEYSDLDLSSRCIDNNFLHKNLDVRIEENTRVERPSPSEMLEMVSPSKEDLCEAISSIEFINRKDKNSCGLLTAVSPATTHYDTGIRCHQLVGLICSNLMNGTEHISDSSRSIPSCELSSSIASHENNIAEMGIFSSCISPSAGSCCLSDISQTNFPLKKVNIGDNPVVTVGCVCEISKSFSSSDSVSTVSCKSKEVEAGLTLSSSALLLESNGQTDDLCDDIAGPVMETIDLCDKVKLEESCVVVENNVPYAVSCRPLNMRSYKKKIQTAFASRKRLAKEYEQLGILYGDSDLWSSQHTLQNFLPSISTLPSDKKELPEHQLCDSEWELL